MHCEFGYTWGSNFYVCGILDNSDLYTLIQILPRTEINIALVFVKLAEMIHATNFRLQDSTVNIY